MGSSKKIFQGVTWSIICSSLNAIYGFVAIPILLNHFGKGNYGLITLANSINAYMQLMDLGLSSTNVRFFSAWLEQGDKQRVKKLFSTSNAFYTIVGIVNSFLIVILYFFSDNIFNVDKEQDIVLKHLLLILAGASILNWATTCYNQIIQATENVAWVQKRNIVSKLLLIIVLLLTVALNLSIEVYYILTIFAVWIILPAVIIKIKNLLPFIDFKLKFDIKILREILPYSLSLFVFSIFSFSFQNLRVSFLGIKGSVDCVADYGVINGFVSLVAMLGSVFIGALLPTSSKVMQNNDVRAYEKIAYRGTKYILIFLCFCVFGMMSIIKPLLTLYIGSGYDYLLPCLNALLLCLLTNHILAISSLILGGTDIKPLTKMTAISSISALVTIWILIPYFQIWGVVFGTMLYNIFQLLFYYIYYWPKVMRINSKQIFFSITFPLIFLTSIIYYLSSLLPDTNIPILDIMTHGLLFAGAFFVFIFFYLNKEDKEFILSTIKRNS